jgi:hypothetical protein
MSMRSKKSVAIVAVAWIGCWLGCGRDPKSAVDFGGATEGGAGSDGGIDVAGSESTSGEGSGDTAAPGDGDADADDGGPAGSGATPATCGNGTAEGAEECDQNDFGLRTCLTYGFMAGGLTCSDDCTVSTDLCLSESLCGDGVVSGLEECEPGDLLGQTCESLALGEGELGCAADCTFSAAECSCKGKGESCAYNAADPLDPGGCCPAGYKGNEQGTCLTIPFQYCL